MSTPFFLFFKKQVGRPTQVSELRRDLHAALSTAPLTSYAQQLQRAQLMERAGDWEAAVEGYLGIGTGVTQDIDALQTVL